MHRSTRILVAFTLALLPARVALAQTPSAAGHWEGAIHAPFGNVAVAVDIASEDGVLRGRFSNPSEQINGLPFARVSIDGRSIELQLKMGSESQTFRGTLSSDGRTISGDFLISVFGVPFDLARTGDAKFEAAPTSPVIAEAFEGTWRGDLAVGETQSMVLTMANRDEKTSAGTWGVSDGVQIPVTIAVDGSHVTIASPVTRETFNGTIDAEGMQIAGTFAEGDRQVPLTLRKVR